MPMTITAAPGVLIIAILTGIARLTVLISICARKPIASPPPISWYISTRMRNCLLISMMTMNRSYSSIMRLATIASGCLTSPLAISDVLLHRANASCGCAPVFSISIGKCCREAGETARHGITALRPARADTGKSDGQTSAACCPLSLSARYGSCCVTADDRHRDKAQ